MTSLRCIFHISIITLQSYVRCDYIVHTQTIHSVCQWLPWPSLQAPATPACWWKPSSLFLRMIEDMWEPVRLPVIDRQRISNSLTRNGRPCDRKWPLASAPSSALESSTIRLPSYFIRQASSLIYTMWQTMETLEARSIWHIIHLILSWSSWTWIPGRQAGAGP